LSRQRNEKILKAVLIDSDSDLDYQPSSVLEKKLTHSEAKEAGTEQQQSQPSTNIIRGKKLLRRPEVWQKNKKKKARNSGQEYEDYKGKTVKGTFSAKWSCNVNL